MTESNKLSLKKRSSIKFCRLCRQHNVESPYNDHICPFFNCKCEKCSIINLQRKLMARQIFLKRADDRAKRNLLNTDNKIDAKNNTRKLKYICQKCKNHQIYVAKKNHVHCPYVNCVCNRCNLIKARSYVEQKVKQTCHNLKKSQKLESVGDGANKNEPSLNLNLLPQSIMSNYQSFPYILSQNMLPVYQANLFNLNNTQHLNTPFNNQLLYNQHIVSLYNSIASQNVNIYSNLHNCLFKNV